MNKRVKGIIAGCGVLAVMGGALAAVLLTGGDGGESSMTDNSSSTSVALWAYDSDAVSKVLVEQPKGDTYSVTRRIEKQDTLDVDGNTVQEDVSNLYLDGYDGIPADTVSMRLLATRAYNVYAEDTVAENAAESDLAKFGLDQPIKVTLTIDEHSPVSFRIGDAVPGSSSRYLCMEGSNTVYKVQSTNVDPYLKTIKDYLSTDVTEKLDADEIKINSVRIEREALDYDIFLEYDKYYEEEGTSGTAALHVMTEPVYCLLSPEKSAAATHGLYGMSASEVVTPHPTEADFATAGLSDEDTLWTKVTMKTSDGKTTIFRLGKTYTTEDGEKRWYGYIDTVDCIYGFSADDTIYENIEADSISSKVIVDMYVWNIGKLVYEGGGKKLDFTVIGESKEDVVIKKNGEAYENVERYRLLYSFLLGAAAEDLVLDPPDVSSLELLASVHIERQDQKRGYDVKFYDAGGLKAYIEVDGQIRFRCRKSYVTALIENIGKFENEDQSFTTTW